MANPIIRGFSKLTAFSGRDTRGEFWPYVGAVIAVVFVVQGAGMGWMMSDLIGRVQAYSAEQRVIVAEEPHIVTEEPVPPDASVRVEVIEQPAAPEVLIPTAADPLMPDFRIMGAVMAVTVILAISLLAAAVSRRLHDRNMAAPWGLLPVPFLSIGAVGFPMLMKDFGTSPEPDFGLFGLLFLNNMVYIAALVTLIILLVQRGTPGPNRYGAAPVAAQSNPREDWSTPG